MSLNKVSPLSDVAIHALDKQLKSSAKYYHDIYMRFVYASTNEPALVAQAAECAIRLTGRGPDSFVTLGRNSTMEGELGGIVSNATVFAIAVTTTYYIKGTKFFGGGLINLKTTSGNKPFLPTMKWDDYVSFMETNHPDAFGIVKRLNVGATRKAKQDVLAVMGYLIEQGIIYRKNFK